MSQTVRSIKQAISLLKVLKKYGLISRLENKEISNEALDRLTEDIYNTHTGDPVTGIGRIVLINQIKKDDKVTALNKIRNDVSKIIKYITDRSNVAEIDLKISDKIYEMKDISDLKDLEELFDKIEESIITGHEMETNSIIFPSLFNYSWRPKISKSYKFEINKVMYLNRFIRNNYTVDNTGTTHCSKTAWLSEIFLKMDADSCKASFIYVRIDDKTVTPQQIQYYGETVKFENNEATLNLTLANNINELEFDSSLYVHLCSEKIPTRPVPVVIKVIYVHLSTEIKLAIADNYDKLQKMFPKKNKWEPSFGFTMGSILALTGGHIVNDRDGNDIFMGAHIDMI
jgi:hypothetical protein